jgi:hypothetical protein
MSSTTPDHATAWSAWNLDIINVFNGDDEGGGEDGANGLRPVRLDLRFSLGYLN